MATINSSNIKNTGVQALDSSGVIQGRTITAGSGVSVSNGDGTSGNPTISAGATVATTYNADTGSAVPALNALSIAGGTGIATTASGSTVTIAVSGSTVGQTITGDTGGALNPSGGNWSILGGTNGIDTAGSGSTLTLNFDVSETGCVTTLSGDTGSATATTNGITLAGGSNGIDTSASGSTVTFNFDVTETSCLTSIPTQSGTATPSSNAITINGSGTVSTSASGSTITITGTGGGMTWTEVTGTSQSMAVNNGYILNNAGLVTATLPATAAVGDIVAVVGKGAGGWRIAQNAGDSIIIGSATASTAGVTGHVDSTNRYDCIELICTVVNDTWVARSLVGNISIT